MTPKSNLSGREYRNLSLWHNLPDFVDGFSEPLSCRRVIGPMHQPGSYVTTIGDIDCLEVIFAIQFVKLPLGGAGMQMRQAFTAQCGSTCGQDQLQAFNRHFSGLCLAAHIKPQNAKG